MRPKLPIDEMTDEEFSKFKEKYLDSDYLSRNALKEINKLFAVGDSSTGRISCDDEHGHGYRCVDFYHPAVGVIHRLVKEIGEYKDAALDILVSAEKMNR